jgi:O-antigen biosynthesis protein
LALRHKYREVISIQVTAYSLLNLRQSVGNGVLHMDVTQFQQDGAATIFAPQPSDLYERISAALPEESPAHHASKARVQVDGKFLRVNGRRFWIKGVTYGTFSHNEEGEPYPSCDQVRRDFEQMRAAGINTVRLYTPPSNQMADIAAEVGLYLIPDICWGQRRCQLDSPEEKEMMREWTRQHARRLANHPAILMYSVGNEIPPLIIRWYGRKIIEGWIRELYQIAKEEAPDTLVTYVNHPPTEYLDLGFLDVVSWNVYLEREPEFRAYLGRLQMLAGDRPLFLAEVGLDSTQHGESAQAEFLDWQVRASFEKGVCGLAIYAWTDEWHIFGSEIRGWSFGLTDPLRNSKPALHAVQNVLASTHGEGQINRLPLVSVVVCAYNAAATIRQCLHTLAWLNYPSYEVIVVDDGSSDETAKIADQFGFNVIRAERGGLSRARNTGIEAARGSIVAFIDADAYADPDWLFFLVCSFEEHQASAVGGPNLPPPQDGFVARCVSHSPGNPTHVLLDNEEAEHIPGCNMAYRKEALQRVGGFDPTHRAAGDDVDVCWKILAREEKIAFAPTAIVWHHRRPTIGAFLRQQRGYGYAEAHLHRKYPGHYNLFGHAVWQGGVYDGLRQAVCRTELPQLLRSRIYHGRFGGAQFQAVYPALGAGWFQLFTTVEWMAVTLCVLAAGWLEIASSEFVAAIFTTLGLFCLGGTLSAATIAGFHAAEAERWQGRKRCIGILLVGFLHLAQPLARVWGRIKGWWELKDEPLLYSPVQRLWGNLSQRDLWLNRLERHLQRFGWTARSACSFDKADIDILGPGPLKLQIESICEENLEKGYHFVRYRVTKKRTLKTYAYFALCISALTAAIACGLWPLLLPLGIFLLVLIYSEARLAAAISQLAVETGESLGMPRVQQV